MAAVRIELAIDIIKERYGNIVAKVCQTLLERGSLSLKELVRFSELERKHVMESLPVLIQFNCVQAFIEGDGNETDDDETDGVETQYLIVFDNILHLNRLGKFVEIVKQKLGSASSECEQLFEGLVHEGRLTLKQMADRKLKTKKNPMAIDVLRETLSELLEARYVERCPAPEPVVKEETNTMKCDEKFEPPITTEQRVLEAATCGKTMRFSLLADSDDCPMTVGEETISWRINFEEFIRHLRRKALIDDVRKRLGDEAATVLDAVLEATRTTDDNVKLEYTVPLSLESILAALQKTENTMTIDCVRSVLLKLDCPPRDNLYSIDLKNIIELARKAEVESKVFKKHGSDALKIFKLLFEKNGYLMSNEIAVSSGIDEKVVDKLLWALMIDDYVDMQRGIGKRPMVIWGIRMNRLVWETELAKMYQAALKLRTAEHKPQEDRPLDELPETSLIDLDDVIMLFHDF